MKSKTSYYDSLPGRMKFGSFFLVLMVGSILVSACASHDKERAPLAAPAWRLVPEAIVLGQRRQFFLYGRHLDSAEVTAPPSLQVEKGVLKQDGRVLSLYLTVSPLNSDSLARGQKPGIREVRVKTPDTTAVFLLKVVDEAEPR
jgi:hypothetical protein